MLERCSKAGRFTSIISTSAFHFFTSTTLRKFYARKCILKLVQTKIVNKHVVHSVLCIWDGVLGIWDGISSPTSSLRQSNRNHCGRYNWLWSGHQLRERQESDRHLTSKEWAQNKFQPIVLFNRCSVSNISSSHCYVQLFGPQFITKLHLKLLKGMVVKWARRTSTNSAHPKGKSGWTPVPK